MVRRLVVGLAVAGLVLVSYNILRPRQPAPELIALAVRATLHAMPSATPHIVEVTRVVEVTSTPSPAATSTPEPTFTATLVITLTATTPVDTPVPEPVAEAASAPVEAGRVGAEAAIVAPEPEFSEATDESADVAESSASVDAASSGCPTDASRTYSLIPVAGGGLDHPHDLHGDLNLSLRGYSAVDNAPSLIEINGPTDGDAPQIGAVLPETTPQLVRAYRVNGWDWACGEHGCRSGPVAAAVSLLGLGTSPGAPVSIPSRNAPIYGGGFVAMVLYAEETRLTLVYTREDTVANGYAVHIENFCVDPGLLSVYRAAHEAGRQSLPAIRNGEIVGVAAGNEVAVAVRDRGAFGDPRSRKDWWR